MSESLLPLIGRADEHPALVAPAGDSVSYAELHEVVERLAGELVGAGVEPGDAVSLSLVNGPEIVLAFLAIVAAGAAAAPLNPGYTAAEFRSYLDDLRPRAMLFQGETATEARDVCLELGIAVVELPEGPARALSVGGAAGAGPGARSRRGGAAAAHERDDEQAEDRAAAPAQPRPLDAHDRRPLRAHAGRRQPLRHAALPRPRPARLDARDAPLRRHRRHAAAFQCERVLGRRRPSRSDVVFRRPDDPPRARRAARRRSRRRRTPCASRAPARRRCRRRSRRRSRTGSGCRCSRRTG